MQRKAVRLHNDFGLTLIELLVALGILALATSGLYASFSMGVRTYRKAEEGLDRTQELRVFLTLLRRELHNMVPYAPLPFSGKGDEIQFPTVIKKFSERGYVEELFIVKYKIESHQIVREETRVREKAGGSQEERKFVVLDQISRGEFAFPYRDEESVEVIWRDVWDPEGGLGLPKGVRLRMLNLPPESTAHSAVRVVIGKTEEPAPPQLFDEQFLIPQGRWGVFE